MDALLAPYSNSIWHADYKLLDDCRLFLCCEDDASRFVTGYGMFEHTTTENALTVLEEAIKNHGKPVSLMTYCGSQFYVNASEAKRETCPVWVGCPVWASSSTPMPQRQREEASVFEKRRANLGIKQILAGVGGGGGVGRIRLF